MFFSFLLDLTQMHWHTNCNSLNIVWYEHLIGCEWYSRNKSHFNCLKRKFHAVIEKHFTTTTLWSIDFSQTEHCKKKYNKTFFLHFFQCSFSVDFQCFFISLFSVPFFLLMHIQLLCPIYELRESIYRVHPR